MAGIRGGLLTLVGAKSKADGAFRASELPERRGIKPRNRGVFRRFGGMTNV